MSLTHKKPGVNNPGLGWWATASSLTRALLFLLSSCCMVFIVKIFLWSMRLHELQPSYHIPYNKMEETKGKKNLITSFSETSRQSPTTLYSYLIGENLVIWLYLVALETDRLVCQLWKYSICQLGHIAYCNQSQMQTFTPAIPWL